MRSKVVWVAIVVLALGSLATARDFKATDVNGGLHQTQAARDNGTLTGVSVSLDQTGPLQAEVVVTATTTGFVQPATGLEAMLLYGQIYDYPWAGGLPPTGTNTFVSGNTTILDNTGQGTFTYPLSFTVPSAQVYQSWGIAYVGYSPGYPGGPTTGFWYVEFDTVAGPTLYIDATVPPTATPDPNAGGNPIPTMNRWGVLAMIVILAGVAMFLFTRRS